MAPADSIGKDQFRRTTRMNSTTKAPNIKRTNAGGLREAARAGRESAWILKGKLPPLPTSPASQGGR